MMINAETTDADISISLQICRGSGVQVMMRPLGPGMMQQIQQPCSHCKQTGCAPPAHDLCGDCSGKVRLSRATQEYQCCSLLLSKRSARQQLFVMELQEAQAQVLQVPFPAITSIWSPACILEAFKVLVFSRSMSQDAVNIHFNSRKKHE